MTELSALNIRITGDAGDLKAAIGVATTELGKVEAAATRANVGTTQLAAGLGHTSRAAGNNSQSMRLMAQQLSQVGQQTMATGQFTQALAIQLPDIGLAFGAIGAAAGLLAGIALPLVVAAFMDTSEKAAALAAATKELADATEAFRLQAAAISLGVDQEEVLAVQRLNELLVQRVALEEHIAKGIKNSKDTTVMQLAAVNALISPLEQQVEAYRAARKELEAIKAKSEAAKAQISGMVKEVIDAKDAMVALVASAPSGGWLAGAISDASTLAAKLWDAAAAQASMSQKLAGAYNLYANTRNQAPGVPVGEGSDTPGGVRPRRPPHGVPGEDWGTAGGGGGGGGKKNPLDGELEALQKALMTKEQLELDSFARQQETLTAALDQRLITQQEYAAMMEAAQQQHSDAMEQIDVWRYGTGLQKAGAFLGEMANVFAAGNDRMIKLSRIAGAAQGLIDAYGAYLKALNAPGGMTPLQRLAMAGGVLAAGLKAVSAIKGGGGSGGGETSQAGAAASTAPAEMRTANINFYGGFQPTQETIKMIAGGLNDWLGDGGRLNVGAS